jgi:hypothetical protein
MTTSTDRRQRDQRRPGVCLGKQVRARSHAWMFPVHFASRFSARATAYSIFLRSRVEEWTWRFRMSLSSVRRSISSIPRTPARIASSQTNVCRRSMPASPNRRLSSPSSWFHSMMRRSRVGAGFGSPSDTPNRFFRRTAAIWRYARRYCHGQSCSIMIEFVANAVVMFDVDASEPAAGMLP